MELGAVFCAARAPRCEPCPAAPWCPSRGRVIAALAAGEALPAAIAPQRLERALAALEHDGLVEPGSTALGVPRLPR